MGALAAAAVPPAGALLALALLVWVSSTGWGEVGAMTPLQRVAVALAVGAMLSVAVWDAIPRLGDRYFRRLDGMQVIP